MSVPQRAEEFFDTLSGPPAKAWTSSALHHGARIAVLLGLVLLVQFLFPVAPVPDFPVLEKGMVPDEDVIAQVTFPIPKTDAELAQEQQEAARSVVPIFTFDTTAVDSMSAQVQTFLAYVDSAAEAGGSDLTVRARLREVLSAYGMPANDDAVALLRPPDNRLALRRALERAIETELPKGIAQSSDLEESRSAQLRVNRAGTEQLVDRDSVTTQQRFFELAARHVPFTAPSGLNEFQRLALIRFFEPSIRLDLAATDTARAYARQAVPRTKGTVVRGERIVAAHEQVQDRDIERLRAYQTHLMSTGNLGDAQFRVGRMVGAFLINLALLTIFGFLLYFYRPAVYQNFRHVSTIALMIALVLIGAAIIAGADAPAELIPIAFPALVVAALWDGRMALNMTLIIALLLTVQTPFLGLSSRLLLVIAGAAAALSVRVVRRRAQGLMLGAVVAGAYVLVTVALGLVRSQPIEEVIRAAAWGSVNGIASALLALGFMPLFEAFTRITTDQTLLELADLNRPLLKRLSLEASGTYAHSINVANLAEAAARGIDANALLVRVGAYYHDVGKIAAPQYFIENQARGRNPHDKLDPATSASLVRSHVIEGMKLADQAKLPDSVKRFIPEHHGTQSIDFFLDRAKKTCAAGESVDARDFAYGGPCPQTRETAILMLADSVESAAKVVADPTPENLRAMVDRIVEGKMVQGQLDETPLTLREITQIKEQFVAVLTGMYHHRIDYPPQPTRAAAASTAR